MPAQGKAGNQDSKFNRKLLKPQIERQRRERVNRSLDRLRSLMLQMPQQQDQACRRMEKTEILERTVFFLKNTGSRGTVDSAETQHFQDGFSSCLQQAALYLRNDGEGRPVGRALATTFSHHLMRPIQPDRTCKQHVYNPRKNLRYLSHRSPLARGETNIPQQPHRDVSESRPSGVCTDRPEVWRPWP